MCSACRFAFSVYLDLSPRGIIPSCGSLEMVQMVYRQFAELRAHGGTHSRRMTFSCLDEFTIRASSSRQATTHSAIHPTDRALAHRCRLRRHGGNPVARQFFHRLAMVR